ncbi:hypothetical protein QLL95_gp0472 [Cotonvirus japonicus]|uniref:Uncharacterized protein n=1 Tax=Cotonvirus japonicus TaxID=2811091 RepID=A0ABM7NUB3_9VIRU|nr:hypothetical protein QLL95_gp0472 [Cotonvirus japonicus]BCS83651.1 hypothetical protein [Cotonvirus japonicus]
MEKYYGLYYVKCINNMVNDNCTPICVLTNDDFYQIVGKVVDIMSSYAFYKHKHAPLTNELSKTHHLRIFYVDHSKTIIKEINYEEYFDHIFRLACRNIYIKKYYHVVNYLKFCESTNNLDEILKISFGVLQKNMQLIYDLASECDKKLEKYLPEYVSTVINLNLPNIDENQGEYIWNIKNFLTDIYKRKNYYIKFETTNKDGSVPYVPSISNDYDACYKIIIYNKNFMDKIINEIENKIKNEFNICGGEFNTKKRLFIIKNYLKKLNIPSIINCKITESICYEFFIRNFLCDHFIVENELINVVCTDRSLPHRFWFVTEFENKRKIDFFIKYRG